MLNRIQHHLINTEEQEHNDLGPFQLSRSNTESYNYIESSTTVQSTESTVTSTRDSFSYTSELTFCFFIEPLLLQPSTSTPYLSARFSMHVTHPWTSLSRQTPTSKITNRNHSLERFISDTKTSFFARGNGRTLPQEPILSPVSSQYTKVRSYRLTDIECRHNKLSTGISSLT